MQNYVSFFSRKFYVSTTIVKFYVFTFKIMANVLASYARIRIIVLASLGKEYGIMCGNTE